MNEENDKILGIIGIIILVGVVVIVAMNFFGPTIGNVFPTGSTHYVNMYAYDYEESTRIIQDLISGDDSEIYELDHILGFGDQIYSSLMYTEGTVKYRDYRTRALYYYLREAASHAEAGSILSRISTDDSSSEERKSEARYYLRLAEKCWKFHVCGPNRGSLIIGHP